MGETAQSQDNQCRRVKAARPTCCSSFQLQTEWKPKHGWWKLPNALFRNSSAHVLWFFPVQMIMIMKLPTCWKCLRPSGRFIERAVQHDRGESVSREPTVSRHLFLISGASADGGWGKSNRWTPENPLVFRQGLDQRQNEHGETQLPMKSKQLLLKPPVKLVSQEKPCRNRFYTVFRDWTKHVSIKKDPVGPEYKIRLYSTTTGVTSNIWKGICDPYQQRLCSVILDVTF